MIYNTSLLTSPPTDCAASKALLANLLCNMHAQQAPRCFPSSSIDRCFDYAPLHLRDLRLLFLILTIGSFLSVVPLLKKAAATIAVVTKSLDTARGFIKF
jgi:hypothetical protein